MPFQVRFRSARLERLETDAGFDGGFSREIVKAYRRRMLHIRASPDERVFYALKSLHFEKLKGAREHQYSMRLNDQWRLILEFEGEAPNKTIWIVAIEDYH